MTNEAGGGNMADPGHYGFQLQILCLITGA